MHRKRSIFFDYGSDLHGNGNILIDYNYKNGAGNNSGIFSSNFSIWISNVLFYWKNKKIVMSDNEIIYYPIIGKVRTYSWSDVKKVRYASGGRGSKGRIIIVTDKTISIEKDMKKFALIEKMIKEKGYLQVKIK